MIWSFPFPFVKVAYEALGRSVAVAPGGARVGHLAAVSVLCNAVPFHPVHRRERRVSSVLVRIWNAVPPLTTLPVAFRLAPSRARATLHAARGDAVPGQR